MTTGANTMNSKLPLVGRIVTALACLPFAMGAYMTLSNNPQAAEGMVAMGWPAESSTLIVTLMLSSVALYLIPPTAVLGAVLLTGYLGGAVATHLRVGDAPTAAVVVGACVWLGLWLREPRLRELMPLRSVTRGG